MRRIIAIGIGLLLGAVLGVAVLAAAGRGEAGSPAGPPALFDPSVPQIPADNGVGERLLLVVGGAFSTQAQADAANDEMSFGDIQGYYVVPADAFLGLRQVVGGDGNFVLASALRTRDGAQEFASLAISASVPARIVGTVVSLGGPYSALCQESDPSGQGPLLNALSTEEQAALG